MIFSPSRLVSLSLLAGRAASMWSADPIPLGTIVGLVLEGEDKAVGVK